MKKYSAVCDICKRTFEHEQEMVLRQMLGFHKRKAHGIAGTSATPESRRVSAREAYWRKMGYSGADLERRRAKYKDRQFQSAFGLTKDNPIPTDTVKKQPRREAMPLALSECPCCGARFFVTKKDSE